MKTISEILTWLKSPEINKCILVEILNVYKSAAEPSADLYFSTKPYVDDQIVYLPIIESGLNFSESLSIDGTISSNYGSIDITNTGGAYDIYLSYIWKRRSIKILLGDQSWTKPDFIQIFDGLVDDVLASNENTLTISLFDKLQKLNDILSQTTLKDTQYTQNTLDTVLPITLGEVFNVQPLLVDNGSTSWLGAEYMVHNGAIQDIIEVRDNGVPIDVIKNLSTGTFNLTTKPVGTITCSVQGATPYNNTVDSLITYIVKNYGSQFNRLTDSDIDFTNFTNTSKVGVHYSDRTNILDACSELATSVNSCLTYSTISVTNDNVFPGKLKLVEFKTPSGLPTYTLTDNEMLENSLSIAEVISPKTSVKLAYCKNYSVQETVAQGVNPSSDFDKEYLYISVYNPTKQTIYQDNGVIQEEKTQLIITSEALAEANKRLLYWEDQRKIITAKYIPTLIFIQLGDIVEIKSARFNLSQGTLGIVYSISRDWITGYVDIGVII